jgi:hypothetical protein
MASLARFGGTVDDVPNKLVQGQRSTTEESSADLFKQGSKVGIAAGTSATLEAVSELAEGKERATVLLEVASAEATRPD